MSQEINQETKSINKPISQAVKLTHVTVFLQGAELFSTGQLTVPAGESDIALSNVASFINEQSLSISASNGVMILSASVHTDFLDDEALTANAQALEQKLETKKQERQQLQIKSNVLQEQVNVLQANRRIGEKGVSTSLTELTQMMDFAAQQVSKAWNEQASINIDIEKLNKEIDKLAQQFEEERGKGSRTAGKIVLKVLAQQATTTDLHISYVAHDAGWTPTYDLKVEKVEAPILLTYKANVYQNTGLHWENVGLVLSTGNPTQGVQAPTLYPWHIQKEVPVVQHRTRMLGAAAGGAAMREQMMSHEMMDVVAAAPYMEKAKAVQANTLDGHVTTDAQGINTRFEIAIPYTIPCDGQGHLVMIQSTSMPASYHYAITPKLDTDAFLQAHIADWKDLNLMPGQTNVYFENSYVGQGYISFEQIKDGMDISLGREKRILVERIQDENNSGKAGMLGSAVQRAFAYTIKVNNTRQDAIKIIVKDQLPVSQDDAITVTDLKLSGATHDEKTGELKWEQTVPASAQHNIAFSYAVKFAKDIKVAGL